MRFGRVLPAFIVLFLGSSVCDAADSPAPSALNPDASEIVFLNRLMAAESAGRLTAKNPASSAYGPYQFIQDTFLDVMQRRFPTISAGKTPEEILKLRADFQIARNAALIYTRENAAFLAAHGIDVTAFALHLAFFAGPSGAIKVFEAKPEEPVENILSAATLKANPSLKGMTAAALIEKFMRNQETGRPHFAEQPLPERGISPAAQAAIQIELQPGNGEAGSKAMADGAYRHNSNKTGKSQALVLRLPSRLSRTAATSFASIAASRGISEADGKLSIKIRCNRNLASCRKWVALAEKRLTVAEERLQRVAYSR